MSKVLHGLAVTEMEKMPIKIENPTTKDRADDAIVTTPSSPSQPTPSDFQDLPDETDQDEL